MKFFCDLITGIIIRHFSGYFSEKQAAFVLRLVISEVVVYVYIVANIFHECTQLVPCFATLDVISQGIKVSFLIQELVKPCFVLWCCDIHML